MNQAKLYLGIFIIYLIFTIGQSQYLETTIYLPDSFPGIDAKTITYNSTNNRIYLAGWGYFVIVIDGETNQKIASIPAGQNINALCWNSNNNKIYCTNTNDDNVTVIDGASNQVITTIPTGDEPCALVFNSINNKVYSSNQSSHNVTVIDGVTNQIITTVSVDTGPCALVYNPTNNKIYSANAGDYPYHNSTVTVIDGATNQVITTIQVGDETRALVYNPINNKVYCAGQRSNNVTVIDGETNQVITTIPVGYWPIALVHNLTNNKVYCANHASEDVTVIDGVTNQVITTVQAGYEPYALVYNPTNNKVYCANDDDSITVIDGETNQVLTNIPTGRQPRALAYNPINNRIYCHNLAYDELTVIDGATNQVIKTIWINKFRNPCALAYNQPYNKVYCANKRIGAYHVTVINGSTNQVITAPVVGWTPCALVYNPNSNKIYSANLTLQTVTVIDGANDSVITNIDLYPNRPCALVYNPTNNKVYCANDNTKNVIVIDGATDEVIATIQVGASPCALVYNQINNIVYCASYFNEKIYAIDGDNNQVIATIPAGDSSCALVYNKINNKVYCANSGSNNVTVIDGATNQLIAMIPVGNSPRALVYNSINNKVYCANQGSDNITVINGATDDMISIIATEDSPNALIHNSTNNKVYCANYESDNVTVIDGVTNEVVTTIEVGEEPIAFTYNPQQNRIYVANYNEASISVIRDDTTYHDVGVTSILEPRDTIIEGVLTISKSVVQNFGVNTETFLVVFSILPTAFSNVKSGHRWLAMQEVIIDTQVVTVQAGCTDTIEFDEWTAIRGNYNTISYTMLAGDNNPANDTSYGFFTVIPRAHDVGVESIISPVSRIPRQVPINVEAVIKNYGLNDETFPTSVLILNEGDTVFIRDTLLTINAGQEQLVIFGNFIPDSNKVFNLLFYTALVGDENLFNDTIMGEASTTPDAGVLRIIRPIGKIAPGILVDVEALIKNFSVEPKDVPVTIRVLDTMTGNTVFEKDSTLSLSADESLSVDFGQFTSVSGIVYLTTYLTTTYTSLLYDDDPTNDTVEAISYAQVGSAPDSFGYIYFSTQEPADTLTTSFDWVDWSGGTPITGWSPNADDGIVTRNLPFGFRYYTPSRPNLFQIVICSNGFLQSSTSQTTYNNVAIPYSQIYNLIAPFWDDLDLRAQDVQSSVYEKISPDSSYVAYTWVNVSRFNAPTELLTFQVVLYYADGKIRFNYLDVDGDLSSNTIGIQGGTGANGWYQQYVFNGNPANHIIKDSTSIVFYSPRIGIEENTKEYKPVITFLHPPRPNPVRKGMAKISFSLAKKGIIQIKIFDATGRLMKNLVNSLFEPGEYNLMWDGKNNRGMEVMSGIYFYTIRTDNYKATQKLVLMR